MKKRLAILAAALLLASCADVPENVKNKKQGQEDKVELGSRVTVDRLLEGAEDVSAYIKEKGYEGKFVLDSDVHIELPEKLYELETETVSEAYRHYPEIYSELFGRDFWEDSGVKDFSELPLLSEHQNEHGFFFDDVYDTGDDIMYSDGDVDPPMYTKYLDISTGGFVYFRDEKDYASDGVLREIIKAGSSPLSDREYTLLNGEKCSLGKIAEFTNEKVNTVFGYFGVQYVYRAGMIYPYTDDEGKTCFYIDLEKCYKGVPFCNHMIAEYSVEGRRQFAPVYTAEVDEPLHIYDLNSPFGIDRVISEKELTDGLVSLPLALDIMNNELSPKIELHISDIRLVYMCDYDSSDVDAAEELRKTKTFDELTREEKLLLGDPTLMPGRRYRAYPVWEIRLDRQRKDENGNYLQREACDLIIIDVQTGKLTNYIDKVSQR